MNEVTARNLYEFGDYFKKSLVLGIIVTVCTPLAFLVLVSPALGIVIAVILIIGAIAVLIFRILMLIRLNRAKESSPHPDLVKASQFIMIAIIISFASIIFAFSDILQWLAQVAAIVLELLGWQFFAKYMVLYSSETDATQGFSMVAEGIKSYIIYTCISLGISAVSFIVIFFNDPYGFDIADTVSIIIAIVALIIGILTIIAQFKVANGLMMIFGRTPPVQPGFQYGTPPPSPQQIPSSEVKYCIKCGTKLLPGAKFCTSCGSTV